MRRRVNNVLTDVECILLIKEALKVGLDPHFRPTYAKHREGCRVDCMEASKIQLTLMTLTQVDLKDIEPVEVIRYNKGAMYPWHNDAAYKDRTHTLIVYLNEQYEGGRTCFREGPVEPKTGQGLYFDITDDNSHCIEEVTQGTKWAAVCWCNKT